MRNKFTTLILLYAASSVFAEDKAPPLFSGLGRHTRQVTAKDPDAQRYFNQGLNFLYAFNHDEAIRSFEYAAKLDPECAMAYWGISLANGPHINNPTHPPERAKAAWKAIAQAKDQAKHVSEVEKALIEALGHRYADPNPEDRKPLDQAYAKAMREVWKRFPKDTDVGVLFAESLMNLRPWDLWHEGKPRPETPEVVSTLEAVMELDATHPQALHLYIHAVEASPNPEKAAAPADRLRDLAPGLGHFVHMPAHIDLRLGQWQKSIEANEKAIAADEKYSKVVPRQGFYRIYRAHNRHMLAFAAMMQGESKKALDSVRAMLAEMPEEWLKNDFNAAVADHYHAMPIEVLVRFGRWGEVLKEPAPNERLPVSRAIRHCARGVAYAALGKTKEAREELQLLKDAAAKLPKEAFAGNNSAADVMAVALRMAEGEILVAEGKVEEGMTMLRQAVEKEDALRYDEPPDWAFPVRHALGATLLKAGQAEEAERVYCEDLKRWPNNGWSLLGLNRSLELQGKKREAEDYGARFKLAWRRADVRPTSSCFCQPEKE